jgi:hypothetical protein
MTDSAEKPRAARLAEALGSAYTIEGEIGRGGCRPWSGCPIRGSQVSATPQFVSLAGLKYATGNVVQFQILG